MLVGRRIDRLPIPLGDEERVHLEGEIGGRHRDRHRVVDVDTEFLEALPDDRLTRQLTVLDMPSDQVPAVRIPLTAGMAMHHQNQTVANKRSDRDRNRGEHGGTLREHAPACDRWAVGSDHDSSWGEVLALGSRSTAGQARSARVAARRRSVDGARHGAAW